VLRESDLEEVLGEVSSEEAVKSSNDVVGENRVVGEESSPVGGPARFVITAVPVPLSVAAVKRTNVDLLHALEHAGDDVGEGFLARVGRFGPGLEARVGEGTNLKVSMCDFSDFRQSLPAGCVPAPTGRRSGKERRVRAQSA